jgi:hypothetical protein
MDVLELSVAGSIDALDNKDPLMFFGSEIEYAMIIDLLSYVFALIVGIVQQEYAT